jgi:hypothetical protein
MPKPMFFKILISKIKLANAAGLLALTIGITLSSNLFAQNNPSASLNEAGVLQLVGDQPLKNMYSFTLTGVSFESEDAAVTFFEGLNTELVTFRVMFESQKAVVMLQRSKQPAWSVADWNNYLLTLTTANPIRN